MTIGNSKQARANILGRIRKAQGRGAGDGSEAQLEAVRTYLRAHPRGPMPDVGGDLVARFRDRAESMQSTTEEVAGEAEVPQAVARYLVAHKLPVAGCVWPALAQLDWRGAGDLPGGARAPRREDSGDDLVGVTGAFAGIAETGTLMVVSGPDTPASTSLLPETHVAVAAAGRIVAHMEEAWDLARQATGSFRAGFQDFGPAPSRTGDIEAAAGARARTVPTGCISSSCAAARREGRVHEPGGSGCPQGCSRRRCSIPAARISALPPTILGIPVDFILFALTLLGVALFHNHTLQVALTGLAVDHAVQDRFHRLQDRAGPGRASPRTLGTNG